MTPDARDRIHRQERELQHCLALLADAIAQAERWYVRQEAEIAAFDRRARGTVVRLRSGGWIDASIVWDPAGAPAPDQCDGRRTDDHRDRHEVDLRLRRGRARHARAARRQGRGRRGDDARTRA